MSPSASRPVEPPNLSTGLLLREYVEHREHGRCADAGADQQHRCLRAVEDERATWCRDVEPVADGEPAVEMAAGGAAVLALDGDPVVAGVRRSRERVIPE